jgi:hypothetical protein
VQNDRLFRRRRSHHRGHQRPCRRRELGYFPTESRRGLIRGTRELVIVRPYILVGVKTAKRWAVIRDDDGNDVVSFPILEADFKYLRGEV